MLYTEYLTPEERMESLRIGAATAMAEAGLSPSEFDAIVKRAAADTTVKLPALSLNAIANTAIVAGVPLGLMYYIVDRSLRKSNRKTKRLQRELDYYNDVSSEFRNNYVPAGGEA